MRLPTRLAVIGVTFLTATLLVVGVLAYEMIRVSGREEVDRTLRRELGAVTVGFPSLLEGKAALRAEDLRRAAEQYLAAHPGSDRHLTVFSFGGDEISTGAGPERLLELRRDDQLPDGTLGRLTTVGTPEGPVRVLAAPLAAGGVVAGRVLIAGPLDEVRDSSARSLVRMGVAGAIGLVLGGSGLVLATRRALRPVRDLAQTARSTSGGDLDARVPQPAHDDEIGELAREFNRMLDRLADHSEQRRRLVAAVSHELRTPLAVAQGHLEMFETLGGDPERTAALAGTLRAEVDRLSRIVDDLGALAYADGGLVVEFQPVFAPDVLDDLRQRLAGLGLDHVVVGEAPPVVVEADQARLAQSLLNLVMNAHRHTPPGTAVRVDARRDGDGLRLAVADDGPGIDPAIRDVVFEPFVTTRGDGSGRGAGLGLAVVKTLTEAQRGTVHLASGPTGTTVTLRFPLAST
jgi:signal transduction histidine kinase